MTKISQLSDIGSGLSLQDAFAINTPGDVVTPNKKVTVSGLSAYFGVGQTPFYTDIMINTTPFIWGQSTDTYYEYPNKINIFNAVGPSAAGSGYTTQPDLRVQSGLRRVGLHPSGFVSYYLDGDNSNFLAGQWLKIYEGENKNGNGTTNNYIRANLSSWASGTVYSFGQRVIHNGSVWECLVPTVSGVAPASGTVTATGIISTAASGNVMVEVPEFFVRVDWNDGLGWKNVAGADVGSTYRLLSPSGLSTTDPLRVYYILPKAQYDSLAPAEKNKWIRHPAFWASGDTTAQTTLYIDGINPTVLAPSPYVTLRDASGVTRVWNGTVFGYYTSSGTATTSGAFNAATATRYRYIAAYQCSTDGTRLQSIVASGIYVSHTRATGLTRARAIASGWTNGDYALWNACQLLTLMEYRNYFMRDPSVGIGRGRDNWNDVGGYRDYVTGILNTQGNRTFNNTTDGRNSTAGADNLAAMQWRGVEHYYGATWKMCNGFNLGDTNGNCRVALNPNDFADNTSTNYQTVGQIATNLSVSFQGGFEEQVGLFFLPQANGTGTTFVTDAAWTSTGWRVLRIGGNSVSAGRTGVWTFDASTTTGSAVTTGSLLSR
jgi:hypothetical protein